MAQIRLYNDQPNNSGSAIPSGGGSIRLYADSPKPAATAPIDNTPSPLRNLTDNLPINGGVSQGSQQFNPAGGGGFGIDTIIKGVKDQYTNPSPDILAAEKIAGVGQKPTTVVGKIAQPVSDFAQKALFRTFGPLLNPLAKDVAETVVTKELAPKVASGEFPPQVFDQFDTLKKTAPQIVGDVAQAVLAVYSPSLLKENIAAGIGNPALEAIAKGAIHGTEAGTLFGIAQAASAGQTKPGEIASTIGKSIATLGILGAVTGGFVPVTKEVFDKAVEARDEIKQNLIDQGVPEHEATVQANHGGEIPKNVTEEGKLSLYKENKPVEAPAKQYPIVTKEPSTLPTIEPVVNDTKVEDLQSQIDSLQQEVDNSPLSRLRKYEDRQNPGSLHEMTGDITGYDKYKTPYLRDKAEFRQRGDQITQEIATEMGHPEWDHNDVAAAYEKYAQARSQLSDLKTSLKEAKANSFADYTPEQLAKINSMAQTANDLVSGKAQLKPAVSTGEVLTSRLAQGVNEKAIENKLTKNLGDLPQYNQVNMKEQASYAADLIAKDPERAMRIAMGQEAPPAHILPESVFTAVEDKATREGDVKTLRDLATSSSLSTEATAMGQRIRALAERDPESPVNAIAELKAEREKAVEKKNSEFKAEKSKTVKEIKESIKKEAPTKADWKSFVESITC